jgi:hypothetical protein
MGSRVPHRLPVNQMLIVEYFFIIFHPGLISVVLPYLELNVNLLYSFKVNVNNSVSPLFADLSGFPQDSVLGLLHFVHYATPLSYFIY